MKVSQDTFAIIGGTSKAATTSIFNYLSEHPAICPSLAKETRFFLDADYPLKSRFRCEVQGSRRYLRFYKECRDERAIRLEATPDYLYSKRTPARIHAALENVQLIFVLRDPVRRFRSWYQFGQAMAVVPTSMNLSEFLQAQVDDDLFSSQVSHPAFLALMHGRYSVYLRRYLEAFGKERIHVFFQEHLSQDPRGFMQKVCRALAIEDGFFNEYVFKRVNKSVRVRSPVLHRFYLSSKENLRSLVRRTPAARAVFRRLGPFIDQAYSQSNVSSKEPEGLDQTTREFLDNYYRDDAVALTRLLELDSLPWSVTTPAK